MRSVEQLPCLLQCSCRSWPVIAAVGAAPSSRPLKSDCLTYTKSSVMKVAAWLEFSKLIMGGMRSSQFATRVGSGNKFPEADPVSEFVRYPNPFTVESANPAIVRFLTMLTYLFEPIVEPA